MTTRSQPSQRCGRARGKQRRRLAASLAAACVVAGGLGVALAAPLGLTTQSLGAASAAVPSCDADGFAYTFTTSGGNVSAVTVADLADPSCESGVLRLTLINAGGSALASAGPLTIPTDGDVAPNAVTLATDAQPAAGTVAGVRVVVEGP